MCASAALNLLTIFARAVPLLVSGSCFQSLGTLSPRSWLILRIFEVSLQAFAAHSMRSCNSHPCALRVLRVLLRSTSFIILLLLPACSSFPTNFEPQILAPRNAPEGWYHKLFLADRVFSDSFSDRIKSKLVPHLRSQVAWERLLIARNDPNGRPHDGYSSLELLEALEHVTFVNSELAHNCYVTCHKMGLMCSKRWAFAINTCDIMKAAYPQSSTCTTTFYGRDLPAYRQNDAHILLNDRIVAWTPSCGASHDLTQRPCGCDPFPSWSSNATFHTVMNCQATKYFEYQSRYSYFWFQQVKMPGQYTRLLSATGPDHLMKEVPTHVAPPHDMSKDSYVALNKPTSVDHWLKNAKGVGDIVVLLDPDCAMIAPMNIFVKEGYPIAQQGFYGFDDLEPRSVRIELAICRHYCPECTFFDPIAVPIIIDRRDLEKIAPLWTKYTEAIRSEKDRWDPAWNDSAQAVNAISWVAEMYGYVLAASKLNIRHEIWSLQTVPGSHTKLLGAAPLMHYHVEVKVGSNGSWHKGREGAGENYIWPVPSDADQVTSRFMQALHDAHSALGSSTYTWPSGNVYVKEPGT